MSNNTGKKNTNSKNVAVQKEKPIVEETVVLEENPVEVVEPVEVEEAAEPVKEEVKKIVVVVDCEKLNLRKSPEVLPSNILCIVNKGTELEVNEELGEWTSVKFQGAKAYAMSKYLKAR